MQASILFENAQWMGKSGWLDVAKTKTKTKHNPCLTLCILRHSCCYSEMWDSQTHSDVWHHNVTLQVSSYCPVSPPFSSISLIFLSLLWEFTIPTNILWSCSAGLVKQGLIGWRRAVVTLLSLNQSSRQLLSHLPPCSFPSLSSSPLPPPSTRLSSPTGFFLGVGVGSMLECSDLV